MPKRATQVPEAEAFCPAPRPKRGRERRRGGAWKVAYADFVTALMALFIVLWIVNGSQRVRQSVAGYFKDPRGYTQKLGAGPANDGEALRVTKQTAQDLQKNIEQALRQMPEFPKLKDNVKLSVTGEGLRVDLLENEQGLFFVTGSPNPTREGEQLLELLAAQISRLPNPVIIEGHTDALPFRNAAPDRGYSNWELSAERANAARRLLHADGLRPEQVVEIRGFAAQKLMFPDSPSSPRNRRVSVVVKFNGV
jgi:chemotaxis protein MotB